MFSRRYNQEGRRGGTGAGAGAGAGAGRGAFAFNSDVDIQRSQLLQHIYRSRGLYEAIVANMRLEDEIILRSLPNVVSNSSSPWNNFAYAFGENQHSMNRPDTTDNAAQAFQHGGVRRARTDNQHANPFQDLFTDISNLMFAGGAGTGAGARNGMTNEQISVAVRDTEYGELPDDVRERYTTCPITLDQFESDMRVGVLRACGHVFRRDAIYNWLSTRHTCPTCRRDLRDSVLQGPSGHSADATQAHPQPASQSHTQPASQSRPSASASPAPAPIYRNAPLDQEVRGWIPMNTTVTGTHGPGDSFQMTIEGGHLQYGDPANNIASVLEQLFNMPTLAMATDATNQGDSNVSDIGGIGGSSHGDDDPEGPMLDEPSNEDSS